MIFQRKQTCPSCGTFNPPDAHYCSHCAKPLVRGEFRCGACGTQNPGDAIYCMECSQPLAQSEAPLINQNRWAAGDNDFAARVDVDDLEGHLKKGINVEAGTNAMLLENGANVGLVPAGSYLLTSFTQKFGDLFRTGLPKRLTILLVKITPTDLDFVLDGIFSKDPLRIGISIKLQTEVSDPAKFLINVLKGRERYSVEALKQYIYPEVAGIVDAWVRTHTVSELTEDMSLKAKLELAIEETLRKTFSQSGLRFLQVRAVALNLEVLDKIKGIKSDYALQISEGEAQAQGRRRLVDVQHELDLASLAEETAKTEIQERKVELYARMRTSANADKMNEIRSENDFKNFLKEIDRQELLDEKEKNELLRTWSEESENHELARRQLLAKLDINQQHELSLAQLKSRTDLDATQFELESSILSKKMDFKLEQGRKGMAAILELEREREKIENEKFRLYLENQKLQAQMEREDEAADAQLAQDILKNMKAISRLDEEERRRIAREDELTREKAAIEFESSRFELEERRLASEREFEIKRLERISTYSTEQLISVSGTEQGRILAELKRTETLKGMTEEQILAMAAEKNPSITQAFVERYKAIEAGKSSQHEIELYERLLGDQKEMIQKYEDLVDKRVSDISDASKQAQETTKHAMDRLAETAKTFAEGGSNRPVIVVNGQPISTQFVTSAPSASPSAQDKNCVNCGRQVEVQARHCPFCGHKFEGV